MILVTKTSDQMRQRGYRALSTLCSPPLRPCHSLDYLGSQLLNQPFIFYFFKKSFHPSLPRFPHGFYNYFAVSCAFSPLFRPPRSYPRSRSRYPRPRSHLRYCPRFRPRSRPVPIRCSSTCLHSRPRPRPRPALLRLPRPPFPFPLPLCPRPHDRSRPRYRLRSRPRLQSHPRPRSLLPVPRTRLPPRYDALVQTPGLANGAVGCSQAPPPVGREGDACGMKVPAVKQKRIAAKDVLHLSLPPDVGTHWSVSPTCAIPV